MNLNKKFLILFFISFILFLLLRFPYRTFIYQNGIADFHIADTSPNFFVILMFGFFKKWRNPSINNLLLGSGTFLGMILYEYFIQKNVYKATIDHLDILASLIGALAFLLISYLIENKMHRFNSVFSSSKLSKKKTGKYF